MANIWGDRFVYPDMNIVCSIKVLKILHHFLKVCTTLLCVD